MNSAAATSEMNNTVVNQMHDNPVIGKGAVTVLKAKKRFVGCAEIRKWLGKDKPVAEVTVEDPDPVATLRKQKLNQLLIKPKKELKMTVVRTRAETAQAIIATLASATTLSSALYSLQSLITIRYPEKALNGKFHQDNGGSMDCSSLIVGAAENTEVVLLLTPLGAIKIECTVNVKKAHKNRYNVIVYDNTLIDRVTELLGLEERSRFSIKTIEQLRLVYGALAPTDFEKMPELTTIDFKQRAVATEFDPNDVHDLCTSPTLTPMRGKNRNVRVTESGPVFLMQPHEGLEEALNAACSDSDKPGRILEHTTQLLGVAGVKFA